MGKPSKKNKNSHQSQQLAKTKKKKGSKSKFTFQGKKANKKHRHNKFWIQTVQSSTDQELALADVTIIISQSDLQDDHPTSAVLVSSAAGQGGQQQEEQNNAAASTKQHIPSATTSTNHDPSSAPSDCGIVNNDGDLPADPSVEQEHCDDITTATGVTEARASSSSASQAKLFSFSTETKTTPTQQPNDDVVQMSHSATMKQEEEEVKDNKPKNISQSIFATTASGTSRPAAVLSGQPPPKPRIAIKRLITATTSSPSRTRYRRSSSLLPNGDCGDGIVNPYNTTIVEDKYWAQRKRLFSRFDQGIQLDPVGWFSVTPEVIAHHIAQRAAAAGAAAGAAGAPTITAQAASPPPTVVLDAFCGCGGNSIAFALQPSISLVMCVDTDWNRLKMTAHNANIYNVHPSKLLLIHDDAITVMEYYHTMCSSNYKKKKEEDQQEQANNNDDVAENDVARTEQEGANSNKQPHDEFYGYRVGTKEDLQGRTIDITFLSPPWGGTDYQQGKEGYTIKECIQVERSVTNEPTFFDSKAAPISIADAEQKRTTATSTVIVNGEELLQWAIEVSSRRVIYFLPRNIQGEALGQSVAKVMSTTGIMNSDVELEQNVIMGKLKTVTAYLEKSG